jgi:hypothetical protein
MNGHGPGRFREVIADEGHGGGKAKSLTQSSESAANNKLPVTQRESCGYGDGGPEEHCSEDKGLARKAVAQPARKRTGQSIIHIKEEPMTPNSTSVSENWRRIKMRIS